MEKDNMNQDINRRGLFTDETYDYRVPEEPDAGDRVKLRFRTCRDDADNVYYIEEGMPAGVKMKKASPDSLFDYYECEMIVGHEGLRYYFRIEKGDDICFYNRMGVTDDTQSSFAFRITPGFHVPGWAKGAVMYQIFVDRFCRGDETNDVQSYEYIYIGRPVYHVGNWNQNPSEMDVGHFYGGDLQGVWNKLDYLQYLGIEVIYFNPLFVSPSNHKYDTQDYDHIDPHFGVIVKDGGCLVEEQARTNEHASRYQIRSTDPVNLEASNAFFSQFVEEIHRRGMRVIIDGVFNHCGSFHKWMDREKFYARQGGYEPGAYLSKDSPFHSFFQFTDDRWPDNLSYNSWWGNDTLPKLNYEGSARLCEYIMEIGRKWVSEPYNVDGWRLDVAADLGNDSEFNHRFWKEFRRQVKAANPDAIILAEHYGDAAAWLEGDEWDTVMNYDAFMEPLSWFLTGMEKHSDDYNESLYGDGDTFFRSMYYYMSKMQTTSLMSAMNQLSNHDHSRFLTRTNRTRGRIGTDGAEKANEGIHVAVFREAVMVQMTWPGAPTLYYGDEAGLCGWTDPDNRRTYPWGNEDFQLIEYHRYMIRLHKNLPALRKGSIKPLRADWHLIAYGRICGNSKCVIVINNCDAVRQVEVPVWELGIQDTDKIQRMMLTDSHGYNVGRVGYYAADGMLSLEMPGYGGILLSVGAEIT